MRRINISGAESQSATVAVAVAVAVERSIATGEIVWLDPDTGVDDELLSLCDDHATHSHGVCEYWGSSWRVHVSSKKGVTK